jgi:hypothetical protein
MAVKTFTVKGTGEFPFDMLRYDAAWPNASDDAAKMGARGWRSVRLTTQQNGAPTAARWESFGWKVIP